MENDSKHRRYYELFKQFELDGYPIKLIPQYIWKFEQCIIHNDVCFEMEDECDICPYNWQYLPKQNRKIIKAL